ncbi:MAG: cell surface protein [Verrucomicrobiales bacterium]|nr:cell surface protein [Verrucomicrobiales bacterium]
MNKLIVTLCGLTLASASLMAEAPKLVDVRVYPADIHLSSKIDKQSIVVQGWYSDSTSKDVTAQAKLSVGDAKIAKSDSNWITPLKDGKTVAKVSFGGRSFDLPVTVTNSSVTPALSFYQDIVPVFTKASCNTGGCHGAASGKDGFMLSLFGYDPDGDYHRVTREQVGRRINLALPDDSLILEKGAGRVTHTGGKLFDQDSKLYQTVRAWIADGAKKDPSTVAKVIGVEIYPVQAVLKGKGSTQKLTIRAKYSDGTDRDISDMAAYITNNDLAADVKQDGTLVAGEPGEAFVMARYDAFTVGAQVLVIPDTENFQWPNTPENNFVDTLVHNKLKKIRVTPSGLCDDKTFVRRAYIDIVGQLPKPDVVKAFVENKDAKKRDKLVDELIERPEFNDIWVMKFAELLQIRTDNNRFLYKSAYQYFEWLKERFQENMPLDDIVKKLITANGDTFVNPAANFYKVEQTPLKLSENTAQIFMGMRIQCAQCHNHPFDRWTMDDYYAFQAFFAQIGRKRGVDTRSSVVYNRRSGGVRHPVGNKDMKPKFLGAEVPEIKSGEDRRAILAEWLASPRNPWFAKNMANVVWAHFFGKGIVEPVDDVRISNPPSNPELLAELGKRFSDSKYNFRELVANICKSRTYQLAAVSNESNQLDTRNFSKGYIRRIRAEVLLDVINQVTDAPDKFSGIPLGSRSVEIVDGRTSNYFLTTFGRSTRGSVCSCEVSIDPNLSQALHLLNGSTVNGKLSRAPWLQDLIKKKAQPEDVVNEIYWRCLSRSATDREMAKLKEFFTDPKEYTNSYYDIFWAVLNSKEFFFNH